MSKMVELKMTEAEAAEIEAVLSNFNESFKPLLEQMRKDQVKIEKLKAETRVMLAQLKDG